MTSIRTDPDQAAESETALSVSSDVSCSAMPIAEQQSMKRCAVKQRIELYYKRLIEGCGNQNCSNRFCASSPQFCCSNLDTNQAAAKAIELLKSRAPLCNAEVGQEPVKHASDNESSSPSNEASEVKSNNPVASKTSPEPASSGALFTSYASTSAHKKDVSCAGAEKSEIPDGLTEKRLMEVINFCRESCSWTELNRYLAIFYNPDALMNSFPLQSDATDTTFETSSKEFQRSIKYDDDKDLDELECVQLAPSNEAASSALRAEGIASSCSRSGYRMLSIDIQSMRRSFTELFSVPDAPFTTALINAIIFLSRTLETDLRSSNILSRRDNYVNLFLIVMEVPSLGSPEFIEAATPQFCKTVGLLPDSIQARLAHIWSTYDEEHLTNMVGCVQQFITVRIVSEYQSSESAKSVHEDDAITGAVKLLKILFYASALGGKWDTYASKYDADADNGAALGDDADDNHEFGRALFARLLGGVNQRRRRTQWEDPLGRILNVRLTDCRKPVVAPEEFVNEPLSEIIEMDKDYINYRTVVIDDDQAFSFMLHPFVLTPVVKHVALYFDNRVQMMNERRAALLQGLMSDVSIVVPNLRLRVRRDHLIDDALVNLEMVATDNPQDLKKQLFVEFEGEQGIDEGGLSKEFFQLIIEDLFNLDIGMFTYDEETRLFWFNSMSFETEGQYKLIGILLGLAIYNSVILDVHFPMVVYKKLMGRPGCFEDLKTSHPTLARSLQELLDYEGDVETDIMQPFSIGIVDCFGHSQIHHLKENGDQIIVTNETRQEFVDLYADFLLNKAVEVQFSAFRNGFKMVTDESPLQLLFRPDEIELLICGNRNYDFNDLERSTQYDGGFTAESPTIRYFWETVHELDDEQKRQLLQFTTGSDRVPVGGLSQLKMVIARNGPDSDRLPTAHTCFNVLLLPEYKCKEKLRDRLLKAIMYSKGFGML